MAFRRILPDAEILRTLFVYDPDTGEIRHAVRSVDTFRTLRGWRVFQSRGWTGKDATVRSHKHLVVRYLKKFYFAHRVAWKMHHGIEPPAGLDHINGNPLDNRIANLRAANQSQNLANAAIRSDNITKIKGVHLDKSRGRYMAYIDMGCRRKYLGRFVTIEAATQARQEAAIKYHGEFARF